MNAIQLAGWRQSVYRCRDKFLKTKNLQQEGSGLSVLDRIPG